MRPAAPSCPDRPHATWLVSDDVPVNVVQKVMGHEQTSTTLNRYTRTPDDYSARVLAAFDGSAAFLLPSTVHMEGEDRS
jgi:integrase